jgi:lipoprotein-anchoring transpeptidase ErfK/SrfK
VLGDRGGAGMQGRFRVASVAVVASVGLLLTAGCTSTPASPTRAEAAVDTAESTPPPQATIAFTPASNTSDVAPGEPVTVTAANGKLTGVTVTDDKGKPLAGQTSADGLTWTSDQGVKISRKYRLQATAVDSDGRVTESSGFFATVTPRKVLETYISPLDGQSVGVGMPVIVRFTAPVKDRAAVEAALSVDSKKPIVGAWSWVSDEEVHFRPKEYWPAYNTVTVHVDLKGVDAGRGVWGMENRTVKFRTGSSMISVVDVDAHTLTVWRNGQKARVIPVSTGKDGFLTRNGIKVILEKHTLKIMDARTIGIYPGDPEYYRLEVPYAMRVTWSGEFVHSAPWSVGSQGRDNVSHGCVGMAPSNAIWLFNLSTVGDIVKVTGSPRTLEAGNGYTDWNVSWAKWLQGSAL